MEKTKNHLQCPSANPDICSLYFRLNQRLFCKHDYVRVRSSALRAHKNANITFDHKYKGLKSTRTSSKFEMILFSTPVSNAEEVLLSGWEKWTRSSVYLLKLRRGEEESVTENREKDMGRRERVKLIAWTNKDVREDEETMWQWISSGRRRVLQSDERLNRASKWYIRNWQVIMKLISVDECMGWNRDK